MPWLASIPLISPTTLFVTGSMMWMLSPAEFVWMIRSFGGAASEEKDTEHRTIPPKTVRHTRNTCLIFIFVTSSFLDKPSSIGYLPEDRSVTFRLSASLQRPMLSTLTTPGCPASQSACLRHERDHHQPVARADAGAAGFPCCRAQLPAGPTRSSGATGLRSRSCCQGRAAPNVTAHG